MNGASSSFGAGTLGAAGGLATAPVALCFRHGGVGGDAPQRTLVVGAVRRGLWEREACRLIGACVGRAARRPCGGGPVGGSRTGAATIHAGGGTDGARGRAFADSGGRCGRRITQPTSPGPVAGKRRFGAEANEDAVDALRAGRAEIGFVEYLCISTW